MKDKEINIVITDTSQRRYEFKSLRVLFRGTETSLLAQENWPTMSLSKL